MIEVNLYSVPAQDVNSMVGRCVARARFDKEGMGSSVMEFVKGFLRDNMSNFESAVGNADLMSLINSDAVISTRDFACINYCLAQSGFTVQIQNVADDEENATGVSGETIEWNVIDYNFMQYDYPTATKIIPGEKSISEVLKQIVAQSGLFDSAKFSGVKNPFTELLNNLEKIKNISGSINPTITSKIYNLLDDMGIKVFCATSED